ncbi:hypothetical protein [Nodosilinea sp. FACHB-13]|uniref:hypothetical protein n=1 Tax=Cyanophyceae TaxID=3028117 RepID=UPI001683C37F|nr:hypothetical protein [Nodosilinea sp. FACHB-13]MBD2110152.1 hypothetical protein [Nodosilinea sp. FACHB-13]
MRWGDWNFNASNLTLNHTVEGYEIDLEEINSSAEMLDWIFQVRNKQWGTPQVLFDLITAFEEILKPQSNYCSFGVDKRANGSELAKSFAKKHRKE